MRRSAAAGVATTAAAVIVAARQIRLKSNAGDPSRIGGNNRREGRAVNRKRKKALTGAVAPQSQWTAPTSNFSDTSASYTNPHNGSHQYNVSEPKGCLGGAATATDHSDLFDPDAIPNGIPDTRTWAMMTIGFVGLAGAGGFGRGPRARLSAAG
jgi:hypothetical protein